MAAPHDPYTGMQGAPKPPAKNVPATTDKPVAKKPPPAKAPLGLNGQANAIVNSELNPVINQARTSNAQQTQAIASFTKMLLAALGNVPGSIGAGYDKAIGTQTNIANAAADALRNANPNQQDQNILNAVGAPQSQHDQIASHLADTFGGGAAVGQYNNLLRTNDLQANKLASVNFAKTLPAIEGLRGNQSLQNALYTQQKGMSDLLSQRPKLVQDALNSLYDQSAKQQQLNLEYQTLGLKSQNQNFTQSLNVSKQNLATAKYKSSVTEFNAKQTTTAGKIDVKVSKGFKDGFAHNTNGDVIYKGGSPLKFNAKSASVSGSPGPKAIPQFPNLTKTQVLHLRAGMSAAFNGVPQTATDPAHPPLGYFAAIKLAIAHGYSRSGATKMANAFYQPGTRGRPFSAKQRAKQRAQVAQYNASRPTTNSAPLGPAKP